MSTHPSHPEHDTAGPRTTGPDTATEPDRPSLGARIGADWTAVLIAAVLVLLAVVGLLPSIPFLVG
jgi:hypothetical protein